VNQKYQEAVVGVFMIIGFLCFAIVAIKFGSEPYFSGDKKIYYASFSSVSGLKKYAPIEIAGVPIGTVKSILLENGKAKVQMEVDGHYKLEEDVIASVRTKGIIGEKYIKISSGASETYLENGGEIIETESVVDIEELIGKFIYSK